MTVLIVDTALSRADTIKRGLRIVAKQMFESGILPKIPEILTLAEFREMKDSDRPKYIAIRFRHLNDGFPGMPQSLIPIYYSGKQEGVSNHIDEKYGFEYGIPLKVSNDFSGIQNEGKIIEDFKKIGSEVFQYAMGAESDSSGVPDSFLSLFHKTTFDKEIERKIQKGFSGSFEFSSIKPIAFCSGLYADMSDIKVLIIGPGMAHFDTILRCIDNKTGELLSSKEKNMGDLKGTEIICNYPVSGKKQFFITHYQNEADIKLCSFNNFDLIIIPAELKWTDSYSFTDYWGISLAAKLRREGFDGLIILPSIVPILVVGQILDQLNTMTQQKPTINFDFDVVQTGFTYLWDISIDGKGGCTQLNTEVRENRLQQWQSFNDEQIQELEVIKSKKLFKIPQKKLLDLKDYLLPSGKLGHFFHEFQNNAMSENKEITLKVAQELFDKIQQIVKPQHRKDVNELSKLIRKKANESLETEREIYQEVIETRGKIEKWMPETEGTVINISEPTSNQNYFGVLLVEDNEESKNIIQGILESQNIKYWSTENPETALEWLRLDALGCLTHGNADEKEKPAFIRVAIVDIRLVTKNGRWQLLQGYDFIDRVHKMSNFITCIALTQKERLMIQFSQPANVTWFPKSILRLSSMKELFIKKIIELGKKDWNEIIPNVALWTTGYLNHKHPFRTYYKQHRMSNSYHRLEGEINEVANNLVELWDMLTAGSPKDPIIYHQEIKKKKDAIEAKIPKGNLTTGILSDISMEEFGLFHAKLAARRAAIYIASRYQDNEYCEISYICYFLNHLSLENNETREDVRNWREKMIDDISNHILYEYYIGHEDNDKKKEVKSVLKNGLTDLFSKVRGEGYQIRLSVINDSDLLNKHLGLVKNMNIWSKLTLIEERNWLRNHQEIDFPA